MYFFYVGSYEIFNFLIALWFNNEDFSFCPNKERDGDIEIFFHLLHPGNLLPSLGLFHFPSWDSRNLISSRGRDCLTNRCPQLPERSLLWEPEGSLAAHVGGGDRLWEVARELGRQVFPWPHEPEPLNDAAPFHLLGWSQLLDSGLSTVKCPDTRGKWLCWLFYGTSGDQPGGGSPTPGPTWLQKATPQPLRAPRWILPLGKWLMHFPVAQAAGSPERACQLQKL